MAAQVLLDLAKEGNISKVRELLESSSSHDKGVLVKVSDIAIEDGNLPILDHLLYNGLSVDDIPTAPHKSAELGKQRILWRLVERGADFLYKAPQAPHMVSEFARNSGDQEFANQIEEMLEFSRATRAICNSDINQLKAVLEQSPQVTKQSVKIGGKSLLHLTVDWPGKRPEVGEMIKLLLDYGAEVDPRLGSDASETPLHYAASCDDLEAATVLIDNGADVNALGAVIGGGPPLFDAVIFDKWKVAELLVEKGAIYQVWIVAGMGDFGRVKSFFREDGSFDFEKGRIEGLEIPDDFQFHVNMAFLFSCWKGRLEIAKWLHQWKPDINFVSPVNTTPLDDSIRGNHKDVEVWLKTLGAKTNAELEKH